MTTNINYVIIISTPEAISFELNKGKKKNFLNLSIQYNISNNKSLINKRIY